jgi:hypothetical protein
MHLNFFFLSTVFLYVAIIMVPVVVSFDTYTDTINLPVLLPIVYFVDIFVQLFTRRSDSNTSLSTYDLRTSQKKYLVSSASILFATTGRMIRLLSLMISILVCSKNDLF